MADNAPQPDPEKDPLHFKVLGRTLEHFGVQMYKRRTVAIAELVANCWDAGAKEVFIEVPTANYNQATSHIVKRNGERGWGTRSLPSLKLLPALAWSAQCGAVAFWWGERPREPPLPLKRSARQ